MSRHSCQAAHTRGRPMDRTRLLEQLAVVTDYIARGAALVTRQRELIRSLRETDQDTSLAELVLTQLNESQKLRFTDFERLEDALACLSSQTVGSESERHSVELTGVCSSREMSGAESDEN